MGEDLKRRRNDQFRRKIEETVRRLRGEDELFAVCLPVSIHEVVGTWIDGEPPREGECLWAPPNAVGKPLIFYRDAKPVIRVGGAAAKVLLAARNGNVGPIMGLVGGFDAVTKATVMRPALLPSVH